jgi:hypothetical protein
MLCRGDVLAKLDAREVGTGALGVGKINIIKQFLS